MKRIFLYRISAFFLAFSTCIILSTIFSSVQYAQKAGDRKCEFNDSQKPYENGIQTYDGVFWYTDSYCSVGYYCHQQGGGVTCIQFEKAGQKKCEHNDSQNPGENGIQQFDGNNWNTIGYCSLNYYCHQQGGGTTCIADANALKPPPPPCANLSNGQCNGVNTGFGVQIATQPADFIKTIFSVLLGLAGMLAVLLIIYAGYRMMVSRGNPEQVQTAREQLTAAIIGLLFMIFSFVILEVIGVDILHIPGFTH